MKKFTKKILSAVTLVTAISLSASATNVSGGIYSNATWTLANSPYIVVDTVVVFPGVTLTIEPGVVVKFADHKRLEIRQASLIALGTIVDSITFTSNSLIPTPGIWDRILLNGASATAFNFCNVKYATYGLVAGSSNILYVKNSNFTDNATGLADFMNTPIDSCNFNFNGTGINYLSGSHLNFCSISNNSIGITDIFSGEIKNSRIDSNQIGIDMPSSMVINNCVINYNQTGISGEDLGDNTFKNCVIDYNDSLGISFYADVTDSIINCEIKFNGIGIQDKSCGGYEGPSVITQCIIESNTTGIQEGGCSHIYCNKFCSNISYDLQNLWGANYSLPNNYWCSTDSATISSHIYDGYDNINLGLVNFMPIDTIGCYLTGCNLQISATVTNATCDTCHNGSATVHILNGFAPYTYTWFTTPIQSTQTATGLSSGTYTVCVADAHGCTACNPNVFVDSTNCTGFGIQANAINATCSTCNDGSASVSIAGGTPPYNYTWYTIPIQTTPTAIGLLQGTYSVCVTDLYGCSSCDSATVSTGNCSAHFNLNPDTILHHYYAVNMASGVAPLSYSWNWGDGSPFDTVPYPNHTYASAGFYVICLTITDSAGCVNTYCNSFYLQRMTESNAMVYVNVIPESSTGIAEEYTNESVQIFPNPSHNYFTVTSGFKQSFFNVEIFNMLGEKIYGQVINHKQENVNTTSFSPGIYLVKISAGNNSIARKLIIE